MPDVDSSALITWNGSKLSSKNAAASFSPPSESTVRAPAHTPFQVSCFSRLGQPRANASNAGRTGSRFHIGSSIQDAGWRRPRYSTGGVGVGGAGAAEGGGQTGFSTGGHTRGSTDTATGGAGGGVDAHAPSRTVTAKAAPIPDNGCARKRMEERLGWVFLEVGLALAILVLIVWWTLPRKPRDRKDDEPG